MAYVWGLGVSEWECGIEFPVNIFVRIWRKGKEKKRYSVDTFLRTLLSK